jgi:hypothetical protein
MDNAASNSIGRLIDRVCQDEDHLLIMAPAGIRLRSLAMIESYNVLIPTKYRTSVLSRDPRTCP